MEQTGLTKSNKLSVGVKLLKSFVLIISIVIVVYVYWTMSIKIKALDEEIIVLNRSLSANILRCDKRANKFQEKFDACVATRNRKTYQLKEIIRVTNDEHYDNRL